MRLDSSLPVRSTRVIAAAVALSLLLAAVGAARLVARAPAPRPAPAGSPPPSTPASTPPSTPPAASPSPGAGQDPSPTAPLGIDIAALARCAGGDVGDLPADDAEGEGLRAELRAIARVVEALRELRFEEPVRPELQASGRFDRRVRRHFLRDYGREEAEIDSVILQMLGAIAPDADVRQLTGDLLEGGVAGFYDPASGDLVVRDDGDGELDALEEVTLSHELQHALADQVLGFPRGGRHDPSEADRGLATLSLIEGDASLTMQRFAATLSFLEQLELGSDPAASESALEDVPHFLSRRLMFPYVEGLIFACALFSRGGWEAVNDAYDRPPVTSAEILFPERYPGTEPAPAPEARPPSGAGWVLRRVQSFGAADLRSLFEAPGDDRSAALDDPVGRVAWWAGGSLRLWSRGDRSALALSVVGARPGRLLCESVTEWYRRAFADHEVHRPEEEVTLLAEGEAQDAVVSCRGRRVHLAIAPRIDTALEMAR